MIESWILIDKTALDVMWAASHPTDDSPIPDNVKLLTQAIRGFWKDSGSYEVVNVINDGTIDQFMVDHAADIGGRYDWIQGTGNDALDTGYETIPAEVLALMKDHKTYDELGNETSSTPPTLTTPNWGHVFLGQKERIFAGGFTNGFSKGFK